MGAIIPTLKDLEDFENRINNRINELKELLSNQGSQRSYNKILTVKDVSEEYNQSAHIQRLARSRGHLSFIGGSKGIQYNRDAVESWIMSKTIK